VNIQTWLATARSKTIGSGILVVAVGIVIIIAVHSSPPNLSGTWSGTVDWSQGDVGHDTLRLHQVSSDEWEGSWVDNAQGTITHTTAVVTPASHGRWQANGSADLSSFTLIGSIQGNTWHGVSEGNSLFGGIQGAFTLHRSS